MTIPHFNKEEIDFLSNADLLVKKRLIQDKIFELLEQTQSQLEQVAGPSFKPLIPSAKISRGENYRNLPYLILDYPATFNIENIFACRTMFLWGHFFSTTLHLQGQHLIVNRHKLRQILTSLKQEDLYVSTGNTPWQYHYKEDNYQPIDRVNLDQLIDREFIKISKKIALDEYQSLPERASLFYKPFLKQLNVHL